MLDDVSLQYPDLSRFGQGVRRGLKADGLAHHVCFELLLRECRDSSCASTRLWLLRAASDVSHHVG